MSLDDILVEYSCINFVRWFDIFEKCWKCWNWNRKEFYISVSFFYSGEKINVKDVIVIIIKILWKEDMF